MSFRWSELGSSPATPDRSSKKGSAAFGFSVDHPSTTPAGPPPPSASSSATFTPAGDPSPSFLQTSIGAVGNKPKAPNFGKPNLRSSKSSSKGSNVPLGRSIRGSARQPSSLSREYHGEDEEDDDGDEEEDEELYNAPTARSGTFAMSFGDTTEGEDTELDDTEPLDDEEQEDSHGSEEGVDNDYEREEDVVAMMEDTVEYDVEEDLLKEIAKTGSFRGPLENADDDSDLMMLATPAADERIRREADDIFRASAMRSTMARRREVKYAVLAKDLYSHMGFATTSEPDSVLLQTEDVVNRLYDEGVGTEDDEEKLDSTLSQACVKLVNDVWTPHGESLPRPRDEHSAKVGPSSNAPAFEKAMYLANLIFRIHHTPPARNEFGASRVPLLPEVLFRWQEENHNMDGNQVNIILRHRPSPAAHGLFWQAVFNALVRGNIAETVRLLRNAAWESVKKTPRSESAYIGQALANIKRVVEDLCLVMEECPSVSNISWDIRSSDWTLFRLKAKAAQEALISFAEGKDRSGFASSRFNDSQISNSTGGKPSLAGLARKAESQIPWDVYENLQSLYAILTGEPEAILAAAQDWCEATIGLFGWWDDGHNKRSRGFSHSRSVHSAYPAASNVDFFDRLALSLHTATDSEFHFNSADAVEVGVASAFEGNVEGVIGFLRLWSLPIATSVAEIASLGRWLPPPEPQNLISMSEFDMDELEVLGMKQSMGPDDKDGIKDSTLIHYARGLRDRKHISGVTHRGRVHRDGWEMAVQVIGRMDSHERSEQMVQELLQNVLSTVDDSSRVTVDKMWRLLNDLGMINFAEDTAETFGDILAKDTFRFGETLRYYALAHRPGKVRDVLNTLMSISLVESTVYPPNSELDDTLRGLLGERTATLEDFAKQDLEAAELLGKMLSGYATLRQFYEYRDGDSKPHRKSLLRRQQAAAALAAVIASADDNIRGGLYDDTRDAVVSEDFLLALLGEISVFVGQSPPVVTLEQIDTLLKAIEDIQTVGSRVYEVADEFFKLVLASGHGKGSTPASLLDQSTPSLGGSFVMTGSSMIASQLHKSVMKSGMIKGGIKRAWDWRATVFATTSSGDMLKQLRLRLTRDLANLWLEQADNVIL
ncbi:hypothetical protein E0Z10_g8540 [Xylaria hypoxylon]|uniref:Nuclear pore complex protein Nup85 n=1 Tax=Xylaria hypoxylon TaxID=37992 RepID=A0A4Z0Y8R5_9PEZI|nr:hypothetical protein E0Z10_g8540 [Xylaria hypoxylon]